MKTFMAKKEDVERRWFVLDAKDKILGRLATRVATILLGKSKPEITPHVDQGDHVIVLNADKVKVTGKKMTDKLYRKHSGYPGGLKTLSLSELMAKNPCRVIEHAVWGMLPKNSMGRRMIRRFKVYVGSEHPHFGQKPEVLEV
ncbi:TPA: 50S ribosomal protein L13 [bacterium]|nr:50S ribosomal protein L13 [bacterium]